MSYLSQVRNLNILPLKMLLQLKDMLLLLEITPEETESALIYPGHINLEEEKMKSSKIGRNQQRKQEVSSSSEVAFLSIDWTTISTSRVREGWKRAF